MIIQLMMHCILFLYLFYLCNLVGRHRIDKSEYSGCAKLFSFIFPFCSAIHTYSHIRYYVLTELYACITLDIPNVYYSKDGLEWGNEDAVCVCVSVATMVAQRWQRYNNDALIYILLFKCPSVSLFLGIKILYLFTVAMLYKNGWIHCGAFYYVENVFTFFWRWCRSISQLLLQACDQHARKPVMIFRCPEWSSPG